MEQLKAEIERKRKQLAQTVGTGPEKKYFKRAELMAKHEEEYLKKHAPQKLAQNLPLIQSAASGSSKLGTATTYPGNVEDLPKLSRREVIRRLRERGEPILLFGESEPEAVKRLRKLEILEPEINRGLRNDFQAALEQVDQAYLEEMLRSVKPETTDQKKPGDVHVQEDNYTFESLRVTATETFADKKNLEGHAKMILTWCKFILKTWGQLLNSRAEEEKLSVRGKLASATYTQTVEYLRPLFRKLKSHTLPDDILEALTEIVSFMLDKEYLRANDAYLEMAIGNAPWPIGVTMVGIHARTGREKIFSRNVAHVMNDETQRKYIQGLKRIMTKCQYIFPTNPSKSVEFVPGDVSDFVERVEMSDRANQK